MAHKTYFKNFTKIFLKADNLYVQRVGNFYYICDSYIMLKVTEFAYELYFAPKSPKFPILNDGQAMGTDSQNPIPNEKLGIGLEKIMANCRYCHTVRKLNCILPIGGIDVELYESETKPIGFRRDYSSLISEVEDYVGKEKVRLYSCAENISAISKTPCICADENELIKYMILPVNCVSPITHENAIEVLYNNISKLTF